MPKTRFGEWTDQRSYWSFYKRYAQALKAQAIRLRHDSQEAERLAHDFVVDQFLARGGVLERYDPERAPFHVYVSRAFRNYCLREQRRTRREVGLTEDEHPAPSGDEPDRDLLAEETARLHQRVRDALGLARRRILEQGGSLLAEERYLRLKWPDDPTIRPPSDRVIGQQMAAEGLLEPGREESVTRAAQRIGQRLGTRLLFTLRQMLREEYARHMPEEEVEPESEMSLQTIVVMLMVEERG